MIKIIKKFLLIIFILGPVHLSIAAGDSQISDQMKHRRAVEAAIWGMPLVSMRGIIKSTRRDLQADWNDVVYFSKPMVSRHGFLTANISTPYVIASFNTLDGPIVVEVPATSNYVKLFGSFVDAWEYPIADVGPKGADLGKGAKYLLLPPGYDGVVPKSGYLVLRPDTHAVYAALRPVISAAVTTDQLTEYVKKLRVYPLAMADNPPQTRLIDAYPKKWNTLAKYDLSYFEDLSDVISEEPVLQRDLVMMGMLDSIGIRKGEPFDPDESTKKILESAITDAYAYLQYLFFDRAFVNYIEGTQWSTHNLSVEQAKAGWPFLTQNRMLLDSRANLYHYATFMPKKLGGASFYLMNLNDSEGNPLDGNSTYKLHVPADIPAKDFWSVIAYSTSTHGFIEGSSRVGISSLERSELNVNKDGSIDIYLGPQAIAGNEANWISTGEDFWVVLRLYGPQESLFNKTWRLPDIEKIP